MRNLLFFIAFFTSSLYSNNIMDYGVKGDGVTLNTSNIQKAIDQVSLQGGGEIYFPAGKYLTGSIILKDGVSLHLSKGATILGSTNLNDYPINPAKYISHINRYTNRYLIYAEGVKNIAIKGEGTIDGQGAHPSFDADKNDPMLSIISRPYVLRLVSCEGVRVTGITMKNSPAWMQQYLNCSDVYIEGLKINNHVNYNNDGIDIDNCQNVQILNCNIDTDDDAICFKTTNATGSCKNIVVSNCLIAANCNAIKLGTETNGGFYNISISNCTFSRPNHPTKYDRPHRALGGLALESVDGATLDGITINNISMDGVMTPIFIRLANRARNYYDGGPSQPVGKIRNVNISNINARMEGLVTSSITGIEGHYVENVSLSNIRISCAGGGSLAHAQNRNIAQMEKAYPETLIFADVPAYGIYVRHVKGLTMNNVSFDAQTPDHRSSLFCDDVHNLKLDGYLFANESDNASLITLVNSCNIKLSGNLQLSDKINLLSVEGSKSHNIFVSESDLMFYKKSPILSKGAEKESVVRLNF